MNKKLYLAYLPAAAWMVVIFLFSSQTSDESTAVSDFFTNIIFGEILEQLTVIIRKSAHFIEYFILGAAVYIPTRRIFKEKRTVLPSLGWCAFYAATDEFHQFFVEGRAGRITDVLIDSCGAALGIAVCVIVFALWGKRRLSQ